MLARLLPSLLAAVLLLAPAPTFCRAEPPNTRPAMQQTTLTLSSGSSAWELVLEDNASATALRTLLPLSLPLQDVNGNEKYARLPRPLPTAPESPGLVRAGDVMLWGDDGLVIFYRTFRTSYRYTRLGCIGNISGLDAAFGPGKNALIREQTPAPSPQATTERPRRAGNPSHR